MFEDVTMNEQGRIVIPAVFRKELGLAPGEKLVVFVEDGGLRVATPMANLERLQARFRGLVPEGRSLSDELIAERRLEAAREDREIEEWQRERKHRKGDGGDHAVGA